MKRLTENFELLTDAEKRICNYIVDNPEEIISLNLNQLSEKVFSSKTVVITMSQKLGFQGFSELKFYIKDTLRNIAPTVNTTDTKNQILELASMTNDIINLEKIDIVANEIIHADTVYLAARGTSKTCSSHLNHLLLTNGVKCLLIEDYNLLFIIAKKIKPNEVLILISLSGNTKKIIEAAKIAKSRGAMIVSLTSFSDNMLSKLANINLFAATYSNDTAEDDDLSRISFLIVTEILAHQVKLIMKQIQ